MRPTTQHVRSIRWQQSSFDKERNQTRAKQLLQFGVIAGEVGIYIATIFTCAHYMKPSVEQDREFARLTTYRRQALRRL